MAETDIKPIDNLDYLMASVTPIATQSSVLVSSSCWLNNPLLRDWIATQYLRRNGPDRMTSSDIADGLISLLAQLRDRNKVVALIEPEKAVNPRFRAWVEERFISQLTREDFAAYAPDWPAAGLMDTEIRCFIELVDQHATTILDVEQD